MKVLKIRGDVVSVAASVGALAAPNDGAVRGGHNEKVAVSTDVRPFHAVRAAGYVGAFFAGGLGLSGLYATTGLGLPCPFRAITGWECPLCGGTRMGEALLQGDVSAAFGFNPVALIGLLMAGVLGVLWAVEAAGGPAVRLPRALLVRLLRVPASHWLIAALVAAVVYTLARNLL
jgi:Protein of unknown function (DUF2752)